ncbi:MAG: hypothetical protein ACI9TV_002777 [Sulfurimonas sp.]|uniref:hypothetical protein n=1 Tax=Sulfurimonas sp. TaxID=2022749 RepID=UPI0039E2D5B2
MFGVSFGKYEFKFHGHFCGDNIPNVQANSRDEESRLLKKIEPIDIIDKACKKHDLCYLQRGDESVSCDEELVLDMKNMHDNLASEDCRRFSHSIIYYFKIRNDNSFTLLNNHGSLKDKAIKFPSTTFRNMMNTASFSKVTAVNYGLSKPYGYIFDSKNNSERKKEVLQIFPPRYKKCMLE